MTHKSLADIVGALPDNIIKHTLEYPGVAELIDVETITDTELKEILIRRMES